MLLSASRAAIAAVTPWSIIALSWALVTVVVVGVVVSGVDLVALFVYSSVQAPQQAMHVSAVAARKAAISYLLTTHYIKLSLAATQQHSSSVPHPVFHNSHRVYCLDSGNKDLSSSEWALPLISPSSGTKSVISLKPLVGLAVGADELLTNLWGSSKGGDDVGAGMGRSGCVPDGGVPNGGASNLVRESMMGGGNSSELEVDGSGGDTRSGGDGICGSGDDNGVSGDGGGVGMARNLSASSSERNGPGVSVLKVQGAYSKPKGLTGALRRRRDIKARASE
ncbi:hypothetical protein Tco_0329079 [Tanacetum coccineum]